MEQEEPGRIIVGVDGSGPSKAALRWAARIAAATGAVSEATIVWDYPQAYGWAIGVEDWRPDLDAQKLLEETLDEVFGTQRPPGLQTVIAKGAARNVLLAASEHAEILVVGSRGHGGFAGLMLGSVSAACAEHAHCPVLVVHEETT